MASIFCNRCGTQSIDDAQFCQRCGQPLGLQAQSQQIPQVSSRARRYAGFWIRVVAALIDLMVLLAVLYPTRLLLGSAVTLLGVSAQIPIRQILLMRRILRIAMGVAIAWPYKAGMESSRFQGTLGKMALRLKVTDIEEKRISFNRATGRYFAKYLSAITLGIGYLMVAFDEQKQALHDRIAETRVLYR